MMKVLFAMAAAAAMLATFSCTGFQREDQRFVSLANRYIEGFLRLYPELATTLGDHRYDNRLSDYSAAGFKEKLDFNRAYLDSLETISPGLLSKVNRIDYSILRNRIESIIFQIEAVREFEWNPLIYNMGASIYDLLARDFAPLDERLLSVKERLMAVPSVLEAARANLKNPPKVHTETALLQNKGVIALIGRELSSFLDSIPELRGEFSPIQEKAIASLEAYGSWLKEDLLPRSTGDFRLGEEMYRRKLRYTLDSEIPMEEILERAEEDLKMTQEEMYKTALPLYKKFLLEAGNEELPAKSAVIRAVLDKLAESHPTNENIVDLSRKCLQECTEFVLANGFVSVPDEPIRLIVMPEFRRGIAIAYCDSPGPLEKRGEAFFAIAPTPADWSDERVESFFREYNHYMLHDLTIHEAMPGHFLQFSHAKRFKAPTKVRAVFMSGTFVEGWATYAEQLMAENGYGGPEVRMQQLKMRLRLIINAIIDQRIHTAGMTEEEALALMMQEGFQEEGEAAGKWRRACLTSTQLSTYYVGNMEVNDIREAYETRAGGSVDLRKLHDKMLSFGSPPPKCVRELMRL